jgi:oxygen-dependent protoporphyrinogen oxidase
VSAAAPGRSGPDFSPEPIRSLVPDDRPVVAVVGGGISGLAAAWRLSGLPRPPHIVVLDAGTGFGGKLAVGAVGPLEIDLGAESVLARRPEAVALIREVGLGDRLVYPVTTRANVVRDGRLHPLPRGTLMGVPARAENLRGLLTDAEVARVAAEPGLPATPVGADVDVASWVAARVGRAVVDRLVDPLLGGVYAGHATRLSLRATIPVLWRRAHAGGSLLDGVARALAPDPGAAAPGARPAAEQPAPVFAGIDGGIGLLPRTLVRLLAERGVRLHRRVTVRGLEPLASHRWRLLVGPVPEHAHLDVDAVVLAVPARPASRLLAAACPDGAAQLAGVEAASVAIVAAVVERAALAGLPGSGVLVPPVEGRAVKGMTFSCAKWAWVAGLDERLAVVRLSLGRHLEEAVLQRDDDDLTVLALADACALLGRPLVPVATRVVRWGGSLPQPLVGHVDRIARLRAALAGTPGLAVCGAALDGVGIPACIAAATSAAAKIAADVGSHVTPSDGRAVLRRRWQG